MCELLLIKIAVQFLNMSTFFCYCINLQLIVNKMWTFTVEW